jgi:hypothetical protein
MMNHGVVAVTHVDLLYVFILCLHVKIRSAALAQSAQIVDILVVIVIVVHLL